MSNHNIQAIENVVNAKMSFSETPGNNIEYTWNFDPDNYNPEAIKNALIQQLDAEPATAAQMRGFSGAECDAVLALKIDGENALAFVGDADVAFLIVAFVN